jgi:hypothetical protein
LGIIEYKEAKKGSNPMIAKINMNHPKVKDWTPSINKMGTNSKNEPKNVNQNYTYRKKKIKMKVFILK